MEHTLELTNRVPAGVWIAIAVFLVAHTLYFGRPRRPHERDDRGWKVLRPTAGFYLVGWVAAILGALSAYLFVMSVGFLAHWKRFGHAFDDARIALVLAVVCPIAAVLFGYVFLYIFVGRLRYNEKGLERDFPGVRRFHPWSDLPHMDRHWFFGPRFWLRSGKTFVVWDMYSGYGELIRYAAGRGMTMLVRG